MITFNYDLSYMPAGVRFYDSIASSGQGRLVIPVFLFVLKEFDD